MRPVRAKKNAQRLFAPSLAEPIDAGRNRVAVSSSERSKIRWRMDELLEGRGFFATGFPHGANG
jgi:hypothetical protein